MLHQIDYIINRRHGEWEDGVVLDVGHGGEGVGSQEKEDHDR